MQRLANRQPLNTGFALLSLSALIACSGSDGGSSTGGLGGSTNGGSVATGGAASPGGATGIGGATGVGGANVTGGAVGAGGNLSTGGSPTTGGSRAVGGTPSTGGANATGGTSSTDGTKTNGGATSTGGTPAIGGTLGTGGTLSTGGTPSTGGTKTSGGATATGGSKTTGGVAATGGSKTTGGTPATGGSQGTGGSTGNCPAPNPNLFAIGVDITNMETSAVASRAALLTFLKSHGINYVRLRTFVDPRASDGYDKTNGYADLAHTVAFGKQVKDACMGLLVDFHYSDNWADPGKQCVPVAWQTYTTIAQLATAVHDYTDNAITQLIAGGARPDMVQIGNEETPGLLIHICDSGGLPLAGNAGYNKVNGALYLWSITDNSAPPGGTGGPVAGGWTNLGQILNAAAKGVKDVDTGIKIALHLDRGNDLASSRDFISNAQSKSVPFDVFGESCYSGTQGQPSDWTATFGSLATQFPTVKFMIAEYSGAQRAANDVMYNMANYRGIGTFNWQPSTLWTGSGTNYSSGTDMPIYDQMKIDYASRL